jgi:hypothetical protein
MTGQSVGSSASYEGRKKARALTRVLTDLIELWERYPKELDEPIRVPTRVVLAGFMQWAELLFGEDHPIATLIKYLGSINKYENSQVQEERLTQRDALEYATVLRSLLRDWLEEESHAGGRRMPEPRPTQNRKHSMTSSIEDEKPTCFRYGDYSIPQI